MLSVHNEDHVGGGKILAKVDEIEESGLVEFVDGYISKPDEELLGGLLIHTGESPAGLTPRDTHS
jgi:hypothetical protein